MIDNKTILKATFMKPLYWFMGFISGIVASAIIGVIIPKIENIIFLIWMIATFIISFVSSVIFIRKGKENSTETEWQSVEAGILKLNLVMAGEIVFIIFLLKMLVTEL